MRSPNHQGLSPALRFEYLPLRHHGLQGTRPGDGCERLVERSIKRPGQPLRHPSTLPWARLNESLALLEFHQQALTVPKNAHRSLHPSLEERRLQGPHEAVCRSLELRVLGGETNGKREAEDVVAPVAELGLLPAEDARRPCLPLREHFCAPYVSPHRPPKQGHESDDEHDGEYAHDDESHHGRTLPHGIPGLCRAELGAPTSSTRQSTR